MNTETYSPVTGLDWERAIAPLIPDGLQPAWDANHPSERPAIVAKLLQLLLEQNAEKPNFSVPPMTKIGKDKLNVLQLQGYKINGYSIERKNEDGTVSRGAVTVGGMVLWWHGLLSR